MVLWRGPPEAPRGLQPTNWPSCCSWPHRKTTSESYAQRPCCPQRVPPQGPQPAPTGVLPIVLRALVRRNVTLRPHCTAPLNANAHCQLPCKFSHTQISHLSYSPLPFYKPLFPFVCPFPCTIGPNAKASCYFLCHLYTNLARYNFLQINCIILCQVRNKTIIMLWMSQFGAVTVLSVKDE